LTNVRKTHTTEAGPPSDKGVENVVAIDAVILPINPAHTSVDTIHSPHDAVSRQPMLHSSVTDSPHGKTKRLEVAKLSDKLGLVPAPIST
jgi:hypothetical protein